MLADFGMSKEVIDDEGNLSSKFGCILYHSP